MSDSIASAIIGLVGAVVGGGISALTNYLISKNTLNQYKQEKSWEVRREAYSTIINGLTLAKNQALNILEGYDPHPDDWCASDRYHEIKGKMFENLKISYDAFQKNRLFLSNDFIKKYEAMRDKMNDDTNSFPPEIDENVSNTLQENVPLLEALAQAGIQ